MEQLRSFQHHLFPHPIPLYLKKYEKLITRVAGLRIRDRRLWHWIDKASRTVMFDEVPENYQDELCKVHLLSLILCTIMDDIADLRSDLDLFDYVCPQVDYVTALEENRQQHALKKFTTKIWWQMEKHFQQWPQYKSLIHHVRDSFQDYWQALREGAILNKDFHQKLAPKITFDDYLEKAKAGAYISTFSYVSLLTLEKVVPEELEQIDKVLKELDKYIVMGNWLSTWEKEFHCQDFTSGISVLAFEIDVLQKSDLNQPAAKIVAKVKQSNVLNLVQERMDKIMESLKASSSELQTFHLQDFIRKNKEVRRLQNQYEEALKYDEISGNKVKKTKQDRPPGPRSYSETLQALNKIRNNYFEGHFELFQRYGDIVYFDKPEKMFIIFHPRDIQHILRNNASNYRKGKVFEEMKPLIGEGLASSEGSAWKKHRKILAPEFAPSRLRDYARISLEKTQNLCALWDESARKEEYRDIALDITQLTLEVTCESLFGQSIRGKTQELSKCVYDVIDHITKRVFAPFRVPFSWPTPGNQHARRCIQVLDSIVMDIIDNQPEEDNYNVLARLLHAYRCKHITKKELRDQVITLLLAGHETTSNAVCWTLYFLAKHPEVLQKLQLEVAQVLGGNFPTIDDLPNLSYTKMAIYEAMRLYPPVTIVSRVSQEDDNIGGYFIPAGSMVEASQYVTHRHPLFWQSPSKFMPERFEDNEPNYKSCAYFPFGSGPRICIGQHFSMMESQIILATLVQNFSWSLVPNFKVAPFPSITLRPKNGVLAFIHRRSPVKSDIYTEPVPSLSGS